MKHFNRLAEFIGNNFIGSFENMYPGNYSSKLIGIGSGKSEFVTFPKHENSTTEGKERENEKSEGKGKGKFGTCRRPWLQNSNLGLQRFYQFRARDNF